MSKSASESAAIRGTEQTSIREGLVTILLGLSIVLVIMNTMMFNLALPSVAHDFGLSAASTSWIVTGYSIVFAISSITYSRLSDFVPIRRLFIIALVSLSAAAIVGLFSDSFLLLLLVRLVQASGAGAIPALSLVLITRYVPLERRGKAMATIMSAASLGSWPRSRSRRGYRRIYRLAFSIHGYRCYDSTRSSVRGASSGGEASQRLLRRARGILHRHRDDRPFIVPHESIRDRAGCRTNLTRSVRDSHSQGAGSLRTARPVSQPSLLNAGSRRDSRLFMQLRYAVSNTANPGQSIRLKRYLFRSHHFSRLFARFIPIPQSR